MIFIPSVLTHGIQLEITRLRYSSKHNLNIYQFNYRAIIQLDDQAIHDQGIYLRNLPRSRYIDVPFRLEVKLV